MHFLAAMRNKALEPLWQNASVLFQVITQSASYGKCTPTYLMQNYRRIVRLRTKVC